MISYCWDASVLLAWLQGEDHGPDANAGLIAAVADVDTERANLLLPTFILAEAGLERSKEEENARFEQLLLRSNVLMVDLTAAIARTAWSLRSAAKQNHACKLRAEDAIYAASCIELQAAELHSFDPHLLRMHAWEEMRGIPVVKPRGQRRTQQTQLTV